MSNKINPNDPAMPNHHMASGEMSCDPNKRGLSIRVELAARAMQGLLASWGRHEITDYDELANDAVLIADALINELNKEV